MNKLTGLSEQPIETDRHETICQVLLDDIEVMADIGAHAFEKGVLQPLKIHVALGIMPPRSDDMASTFDYTNIHGFASQLATQRIVLIETFAQRLAQMCLQHDAVINADIRIEKPRAITDCMAGTRVKLNKF